jgi:hypothetical protein
LFSYDAATAAGFLGGSVTTDVTFAQNYGYIHKAGGPFSAILVPAAGTIP